MTLFLLGNASSIWKGNVDNFIALTQIPRTVIWAYTNIHTLVGIGLKLARELHARFTFRQRRSRSTEKMEKGSMKQRTFGKCWKGRSTQVVILPTRILLMQWNISRDCAKWVWIPWRGMSVQSSRKRLVGSLTTIRRLSRRAIRFKAMDNIWILKLHD